MTDGHQGRPGDPRRPEAPRTPHGYRFRSPSEPAPGRPQQEPSAHGSQQPASAPGPAQGQAHPHPAPPQGAPQQGHPAPHGHDRFAPPASDPRGARPAAPAHPGTRPQQQPVGSAVRPGAGRSGTPGPGAAPHASRPITGGWRRPVQPGPIRQHSGAPVQAGWTQQFQLPQKPERSDPNSITRIVLLIVGGIATALMLFALLAGLLLYWGMSSFSPLAILIVLASSIPLTAIVGTLFLIDRWKPQPIILFPLCVLWGAVAAVIFTLIANAIGISLLGVVGFDATGPVFGAVVLAPVFEEITKGFLLVILILAASRYFEGPLDGFMYGSLIGAGFAFTENILYLTSAYNEGAAFGLVMTFVMRCLVSPLLHSAFTGVAGLTIGLAARRMSPWLAAVMWIPGLIAGMLLHGLWNLMASIPYPPTGLGILLSLGITLVLAVIIAACWWTTAFVLRHREAKQTHEALRRYAGAGWLTEEEAQMLGTWSGRRAGRRWAARSPQGKSHMKAMIRTAASLPAVRSRIDSGVGGEKEKQYEVFLLERLGTERGRLMAAMGLPG